MWSTVQISDDLRCIQNLMDLKKNMMYVLPNLREPSWFRPRILAVVIMFQDGHEPRIGTTSLRSRDLTPHWMEARGSSSIHATTIAVTSMTSPSESPLCCGCPLPQKHFQRPRSAEIFQLWWSRPPGTERRPGRPIMFKLSSPPAVKSRASISLAPSLCGPARLFGPEGRGGRPANLKARGRPDRGAVLAHVHTDGSDWPGAEQHPGPPPSRAT